MAHEGEDANAHPSCVFGVMVLCLVSDDNGKANQTGSCFLGHDLCDEIGTWISIDSDFPNGCSWSTTTTVSALA